MKYKSQHIMCRKLYKNTRSLVSVLASILIWIKNERLKLISTAISFIFIVHLLSSVIQDTIGRSIRPHFRVTTLRCTNRNDWGRIRLVTELKAVIKIRFQIIGSLLATNDLCVIVTIFWGVPDAPFAIDWRNEEWKCCQFHSWCILIYNNLKIFWF